MSSRSRSPRRSSSPRRPTSPRLSHAYATVGITNRNRRSISPPRSTPSSRSRSPPRLKRTQRGINETHPRPTSPRLSHAYAAVGTNRKRRSRSPPRLRSPKLKRTQRGLSGTNPPTSPRRSKSPRKPTPNYKRPSPPYPARMYPGDIMKGNFGVMYYSALLSNGQYRWLKYPPAKKADTPSDKTEKRMMVKGTLLSPRERKWCRCVLHVAAKQNKRCLKQKKWREVVDGEVCTNPYAVCSKSVGTSTGRKSCAMWYNFKDLTLDELLGYANLKSLDVPSGASKAQVLKIIDTYKKEQGY